MTGSSLSLEAQWVKYEDVSARLSRYLKTSEEEFGRLIQALDECWTLAEKVQAATGRLLELTGATDGGESAVLRSLMLCAWDVSRVFLKQIQGGSEQLSMVMRDTRELLGVSNRMEEDLQPLKYIAMYLRLEGSRLAELDSSAVQQFHRQMLDVLSAMRRSGESQRETLDTILKKLLAATKLVEQASISHALRASTLEVKTKSDLDLLTTVPPDLFAVQHQAESLQGALSGRIRDAVTSLQGHDAIRQRLQHILLSLNDVQSGRESKPGRALLIQRRQAGSVLEQIVKTGRRIEQDLKGIIESAHGIGAQAPQQDTSSDGAEAFESAVDSLASLGPAVTALLSGEVEVGVFVLGQIEPIRDLLSAKSRELESMAGSLKILAMNVVIVAKSIPAAKSIDVLGAWTSEAAEGVLIMARKLNLHFDRLGEVLHQLAIAIRVEIAAVESCRTTMSAHQFDDSLRSSRRDGYQEAQRLRADAHGLQHKTEGLLESVTFVREGTALLEELNGVLGCLLTHYPKADPADDLDSASAGYVMQSQHKAHALASGEQAGYEYARISKVVEGQDYGENVELF